MKTNIKNFLTGLILGVANIIPGVSGGTIAMSLGIYEKLISIISSIVKNCKKNVLFLDIESLYHLTYPFDKDLLKMN